MKILLLFLLLGMSSQTFAKSYMAKTYNVEFDAYLTTEMLDVDHAIKRQINHTLGPSTVLKSVGKRSSLGHNYTTEILKIDKLNTKLKKVYYRYSGTLLAEENVDLKSYLVVAPIRAREAFEKSRRRCSKMAGLQLFYLGWSPYYKKCRLIKGQDYEEFKLITFSEITTEKRHTKSDFLVKDEYKLYYYFGSDYHSLSRLGSASSAASDTIRYFKKRGFKAILDNQMKQNIFGKTSLKSHFKVLAGKIDDKVTFVYVLIGNPTEETPVAQYEFFRFFKHAFEFASAIQYSGHAGLGSVLDFDYHEKTYNEKITYNSNQKQIFYLNGCSTFIHSTGFFFQKKPLNNSLVLMTNGLSISTKFNKAPSLLVADVFYNQNEFSNFELRQKTDSLMRSNGAFAADRAMVAVESN